MAGDKTLKNAGFTLIELLVVIVILGILVSFGLPSYHKTLEKVRSNEAISQLKIVQARERVKHLQTGAFITCVNTSDCNDELRLSLPIEYWDYQVSLAGGDFNATASRTSGAWSSCVYWINSTANITSNNGNCVYTETVYWGS